MGQDLAPSGTTPHRPDYVLLGVVIALLAFGLVMVLTSSMVTAYNNHGTEFYYLGRQGLWTVLGLVAMVVAWRLDHRRLGPLALWLLLGCIVVLVAVLLFAEEINGAKRWLTVGPFSIQPSELTKLGITLYMAYWLASKEDQVKSLAYQFVPFVIITATIVMLLLRQPGPRLRVRNCGDGGGDILCCGNALGAATALLRLRHCGPVRSDQHVTLPDGALRYLSRSVGRSQRLQLSYRPGAQVPRRGWRHRHGPGSRTREV